MDMGFHVRLDEIERPSYVKEDVITDSPLYICQVTSEEWGWCVTIWWNIRKGKVLWIAWKDELKEGSSVKERILEDVEAGRSFMKRRNNTGVTFEPRGTPELIEW